MQGVMVIRESDENTARVQSFNETDNTRIKISQNIFERICLVFLVLFFSLGGEEILLINLMRCTT